MQCEKYYFHMEGSMQGEIEMITGNEHGVPHPSQMGLDWEVAR